MDSAPGLQLLPFRCLEGGKGTKWCAWSHVSQKTSCTAWLWTVDRYQYSRLLEHHIEQGGRMSSPWPWRMGYLPACRPQTSRRNDTQLLGSLGCVARRHVNWLSARVSRVSIEISSVLFALSYRIGHRCHKSHTYLVWTFSYLIKTVLRGPYGCSTMHQNVGVEFSMHSCIDRGTLTCVSLCRMSFCADRFVSIVPVRTQGFRDDWTVFGSSMDNDLV